MTRPITILALSQTLVIFLGFFALAMFLKIYDYPDNEWMKWNRLPVFLRENGLLLLCLPTVWVVYALVCEKIDRGILSSRAAFIAGVLGVITLVYLFGQAIIDPGHRRSLF